MDETLPQSLVDQMQVDIPLTLSPTPQIVAATPITYSQSRLTKTTLKASKGVKRKLFSESKDRTLHSTKQTHAEENAYESDQDSIHLLVGAFKD
ncbi:hypothetical protein QYF36_014874 [Acer negundo]|nr:hypothetical protein QYF36_014874 [Acer negundo]